MADTSLNYHNQSQAANAASHNRQESNADAKIAAQKPPSQPSNRSGHSR
jgi:hypothetical protein